MKCALIKRDGSTGSFGNVTAARGGAYCIAIEALRLERVVVFHLTVTVRASVYRPAACAARAVHR